MLPERSKDRSLCLLLGLCLPLGLCQYLCLCLAKATEVRAQ